MGYTGQVTRYVVDVQEISKLFSIVSRRQSVAASFEVEDFLPSS
jgi:hypothetical protein